MNAINKYSNIFWRPFLTWVFIWINAINDALFYYKWLEKEIKKEDFIITQHDLESKILEKIVLSEDDFLLKKDNFNIHFTNDIKITNTINISIDKELTYWDWYSYILAKIAKNMDLIKETHKNSWLNISIVWFLFDRNEGDCLWNIDEIKRILELLWITVNSVWLDWWNYSDLKSINKSELIISLANWKKASEILSKKLDIDYIELDIPFWLKNTIDFIEKIANKLWIDNNKVNNMIKQEVEKVMSKIIMLDENIFLSRNYVFVWDLYYEKWIKDIWTLLWMNYLSTINTNKMNNENDLDKMTNLIIWNSDYNINNYEIDKLEFWFPSYNSHFLLNRPYMWFTGLLFFIERLYKELFIIK